MMRTVSQETLDQAAALRAEGMSWDKIGRVVGLDRDLLRYRLDPQYRAHRRVPSPDSMLIVRGLDRPTQRQIEAMQDAVPRDTRGLTARMMGDPLPGRSALDQKRSQVERVFHAKISASQMRAY